MINPPRLKTQKRMDVYCVGVCFLNGVYGRWCDKMRESVAPAKLSLCKLMVFDVLDTNYMLWGVYDYLRKPVT